MRPVESLMFPFLQAGLAVPFHTLTFSKHHGASSWGFPGSSVVKRPSAKAGDVGDSSSFSGSLGQEDPLEEGMAMHSSILAWRIAWTEEPGRL